MLEFFPEVHGEGIEQQYYYYIIIILGIMKL